MSITRFHPPKSGEGPRQFQPMTKGVTGEYVLYGDHLIRVEDERKWCGETKDKLKAARKEIETFREELARHQSGHEALYDRAEAAEQRNAELVELLNIVRDDTGQHYSENLQCRILAALKPTESEARE